ncbi:hypothetical protein BsWGS_03987 [Bradybaena similaris]
MSGGAGLSLQEGSDLSLHKVHVRRGHIVIVGGAGLVTARGTCQEGPDLSLHEVHVRRGRTCHCTRYMSGGAGLSLQEGSDLSLQEGPNLTLQEGPDLSLQEGPNLTLQEVHVRRGRTCHCRRYMSGGARLSL